MRALLLPLLVLAGAPRAAALGLRTRFAEVTVENLKAGTRTSLAEAVNLPLRVMNTDKDPVELSVTPLAPTAAELKAGYEAIPDPAWVEVQSPRLTVPGGLEGVTDIAIKVPDDPKLLGRRFQVMVWTRSENAGSLGVGLKSRILLSVSSQRPTDAELKAAVPKRRLANMSFSLSPMELSQAGVRPGKGQALPAIKLVNPDAEALTFRLTPVPVWETALTPPPGWEAAPDPKWLKVPEPVLKLKGESIKKLKLSLELPADEKLKGRKFLFILRAEVLEQDIPAYAYVRLLVETEQARPAKER